MADTKAEIREKLKEVLRRNRGVSDADLADAILAAFPQLADDGWVSVGPTSMPKLWQEVLVFNEFGQGLVEVVPRNVTGAPEQADFEDFAIRGYSHWRELSLAPQAMGKSHVHQSSVRREEREMSSELCKDCGRQNPVWFTPNAVWNRVMGKEGGILCPTCFLLRSNGGAWELRPEGYKAPDLCACPTPQLSWNVTEPCLRCGGKLRLTEVRRG